MIPPRGAEILVLGVGLVLFAIGLALEAIGQRLPVLDVRLRISPGYVVVGFSIVVLVALGLGSLWRRLADRALARAVMANGLARERLEEQTVLARAEERCAQEAARARLLQRLKHEVEHPVGAVQAILKRHVLR